MTNVVKSFQGNKFTHPFSSVGTECEAANRCRRNRQRSYRSPIPNRTLISLHILQRHISSTAMTQRHTSVDSSTSPTSRSHTPKIIDVHHHVFPDAQQKVKKNTLVGWITPLEHLPWQPSPVMSAMDSMDIQIAILSPPPVATTNRAEVRAMNIYLSQLRAAYPARFGFFAGLPTLGDVQGSDTLGESQ